MARYSGGEWWRTSSAQDLRPRREETLAGRDAGGGARLGKNGARPTGPARHRPMALRASEGHGHDLERSIRDDDLVAVDLGGRLAVLQEVGEPCLGEREADA